MILKLNFLPIAIILGLTFIIPILLYSPLYAVSEKSEDNDEKTHIHVKNVPTPPKAAAPA